MMSLSLSSLGFWFGGAAGFRVLGFRLRWLRVQVVGFLGYS